MKAISTIVFIVLTMFLPTVFAQMMDGGMMGGGMMNGGMMGQSQKSDQATSSSVNQKHADELLAYIRKNGLTCTSCHSISGAGVGPSFAAISANYANRADAATILGTHIANGFGRMPGSLASKSQAAILGKMILEITESE